MQINVIAVKNKLKTFIVLYVGAELFSTILWASKSPFRNKCKCHLQPRCSKILCTFIAISAQSSHIELEVIVPWTGHPASGYVISPVLERANTSPGTRDRIRTWNSNVSSVPVGVITAVFDFIIRKRRCTFQKESSDRNRWSVLHPKPTIHTPLIPMN